MSDDTKNWSQIAAKLRRALGLAPPSLEKADAEMGEAEAAPMTAAEIERIADAVIRHEEPGDYELQADYTWAGEYASDEVAEDMLVLNREAGEDDPETDRRIEELRREALRDDDEGNDET